jgi:hypothetical protein
MIPFKRNNIEVEVSGVRYGGSYQVRKSGLVRVHTPYGIKATQIDGTPVEVLAKRLLRELIETEMRRPDSTL